MTVLLYVLPVPVEVRAGDVIEFGLDHVGRAFLRVVPATLPRVTYRAVAARDATIDRLHLPAAPASVSLAGLG